MHIVFRSQTYVYVYVLFYMCSLYNCVQTTVFFCMKFYKKYLLYVILLLTCHPEFYDHTCISLIICIYIAVCWRTDYSKNVFSHTYFMLCKLSLNLHIILLYLLEVFFIYTYKLYVLLNQLQLAT